MKWMIMAGVLVVLAALAGVKVWIDRRKERQKGIRRWEEKWARQQREYEERSAELAALTPEERQARIDDNYHRLAVGRQKRYDAIRARREAVAAAREAAAAQGGEADAAAAK